MAACSEEEQRQAGLVIDSLRAFGGDLSEDPVWIYLGEGAPGTAAFGGNTQTIPLTKEASVPTYPAGVKVLACAAAEEKAEAEFRSLTWLNLDCVILQPPLLYGFSSAWDAAVRPVHIRNIGSPAAEPPDEFWSSLYRYLEIDHHCFTVESFVDRQVLRPYFNTHSFTIDPAERICRAWLDMFRALILDSDFQQKCCSDLPHRIFLHQAIFSTLVMKKLEHDRIQILPPDYNYPLHLQDQIPAQQRRAYLDQLTCAVYEETDNLRKIGIREPLLTWLLQHAIQI